jgi:hypothetical protein
MKIIKQFISLLIIFLSFFVFSDSHAWCFDNEAKTIAGGLEKSAETIAAAVPSIGKGLEAVGQGLNVIGQAATLGAQVYAVHEGYTIAKDVGSHFFPDEIVQKKNKTIKIKRQLRECLMENHHSERGKSGRPMVCENEARMFAMIAGKQKLDEMTTTFTEFYGK